MRAEPDHPRRELLWESPAVLSHDPPPGSSPTVPESPSSTTVRKPLGRRRRWPFLAAMVLLAAVAVALWLVRLSYDPDRLWSNARQAARAEDWQAAASALERIAKLQPLTGEQGMLLAQAHQRLDETDAALAALDAVPADDPLAARARMLAGQVRLRHEHLADAEARFREASSSTPP